MWKRLLIIAFAGAAIWTTALMWEQGKKLEKAEIPWEKMDSAKVARLSIASAQGAFDLQKNGTSWTIEDKTRNATHRGDSEKIEALIQYVGSNPPLRDLGKAKPNNLLEYGLQSPSAVLTVYGQATAWTLSLGTQNPLDDGVYAQTSSGKDVVYLLDRRYLEQLGKQALDYADLRLMSFDEDKVERLVLNSKEHGSWEIVKNGETFQFKSFKPGVMPSVSEDELRFYIHTLATASASSPVPQEATLKPDRQFRIEVYSSKDPHPHFLEVFGSVPTTGERWAKSSFQPNPVMLHPEKMNGLLKRAFDLKDKHFIRLDIGAVTQMRFISGDQELRVTKTGSGWKEEASAKEIPGLETVLWRLSDLKYTTEPLTRAPKGAVPVVTWWLSLGDAKKHQVVFLSTNITPGQCLVRIDDAPSYYTVEDSLLKDVQNQIVVNHQAKTQSGS